MLGEAERSEIQVGPRADSENRLSLAGLVSASEVLSDSISSVKGVKGR